MKGIKKMNEFLDNISKKIYYLVISESLPVDVFFTGSVSRNEERIKDGKIISDIDILVILKYKRHLRVIRNKFELLKQNEGIFQSVAITFCLYKNLKTRRLADYVLSIDFNKPIVKALNKNYQFYYDKIIYRSIYQMQSSLYYFCKQIVTKEDIFSMKCFVNTLKSLLYIYGFTQNLSYIKDLSLLNYIDKLQNIIEKDELYIIIECIRYSKELPLTLINKIKGLNISMLEDLIQKLKVAKYRSLLPSVRFFIKNKSQILLEENEQYASKYMGLVTYENLGIKKGKAFI